MFLYIDFEDNDFGIPAKNALIRLWGYVNNNNNNNGNGDEISSLFQKLHKGNMLLPMVSKLFFLEVCASDVEFATRGLSKKHESDLFFEISEIPENIGICIKILGFFESGNLPGRNHEIACLDCETGFVKTL